MLLKWLAVVVGLAVVAAACTSDAAALSVEEYAAALQEVESDFDSATPDVSEAEADPDEYPLGGDLVAANSLYMKFEERLAGWRAISPPPEMSKLHTQLIAALDEVQREVGEYLGEHAMTDGDFDFDTIGPAVEPFLANASAACRELRAALEEADAGVVFVEACEF